MKNSPLPDLTALANDGTVTAKPDDAFIGFGNEVAVDADGWALVRYGEWPHERGLQRFGREQAEEIERYFRNGWNTIKRAIVGLPVFHGHPDRVEQLETALANTRDARERAAIEREIAEVKRRYPDRTVYGSIADLEVRDDGLAIKPVLTGDGAALVNEKGKRFFSPHWLARKLGEEKGRTVFGPAFLLSIGLTDNPNIAGTSLVNARSGSPENSNHNQNPTMPKWLLDLLGFANEAEATQEKITEKINSLLARPEQTALANEQSRATALTNDLATAKQQLTEAQTALANERKAHAEALVATAVKDGRITEAQKPVWLTRLDRDFATESAALANEAPKMKTHGRSDAVAGRQVTSDVAAQFEALVNEATPKFGGDRDRAWQHVKSSKAGKALWEQMQPAKN